jgi:hypothetical protein
MHGQPRSQGLTCIVKMKTTFIYKIHPFDNYVYVTRVVGTGGGGGKFFKGLKVPFFVMKSALFVQANVAVNTKLTSKVPFLFGNFQVF